MFDKISLKRNLITGWFCHLVSMAVGFYLMRYVLLVIGDDNYGLWVFINSIAAYSGLMYLGFGETICRYIAKYNTLEDNDRMNKAVNVVMVVYCFMGFAILLGAGLFAWQAPNIIDLGELTHQEVATAIMLIGISMTIGMITSVFGGVLAGTQRMDLIKLTTASAFIIRLSLTYLLLSKETPIVTLSFIFLMVTIFEQSIIIYLAFKNLPSLRIGLKYWDTEIFKECAGFSGFAFLDVISHRLIHATDVIIIGLYFPKNVIVPYYIASRLCSFCIQPIKQIGYVVMPRASQFSTKGDFQGLKGLVKKGVGLSILLVCSAFIGSWFFAGNFVDLWMKKGYEESHVLLLILLGAHVLVIPVDILKHILYGMGIIRFIAFLGMAEAIVNLILSIILLHYYQLIGVALGTVIPVIVFEFIILTPYALKKIEFPPIEFIKTVVFPQFLPLVALFVYCLVIENYYPGDKKVIGLALITFGGMAIVGITWLANHKLVRLLVKA